MSDDQREDLAAALYEHLRRRARLALRGRGMVSLQPTELVHEVFMRLASRRHRQQLDGDHFLALATRMMRDLVVDHIRRRLAGKRGGGQVRVTLGDELDAAAPPTDPDTWLDLEAALDRLSTLAPRRGQVAVLTLLGGFQAEDIARLVGVCRRTIDRDWRAAQAWLSRELRRA